MRCSTRSTRFGTGCWHDYPNYPPSLTPPGMFVNSKVNGFFLLLTFGLLCAIVIGTIVGLCVATFMLSPSLAAGSNVVTHFAILLYGPFVGICLALLPGILYGLASFYFTKRWHWLVDGAFYGAIGYLIAMSVTPQGFVWIALLVCAGCGSLVGIINLTFPNWWGMRLRAQGIELLRQKS